MGKHVNFVVVVVENDVGNQTSLKDKVSNYSFYWILEILLMNESIKLLFVSNYYYWLKCINANRVLFLIW